MRRCPKCGKTYDESWKICIKCNALLVVGEDRLTHLENQANQILREIKEIREGKPVVKKEIKKTEFKKEEPAKAQAPSVPKESTETRIGKYFLQKIGIASLIIGIAFFVAYTFKYLLPVHKVLIGYLIGAALLFLGVKIEKNDKFKWYGRTLIGGGWSLVYFMTFAMHHIQATRVIQSHLVDLILLAIVVTFMIAHLFKYRSQGIVVLVLFLGYFTAGISRVDYFTFVYIGLLAVIAVSLAYKMKWYEMTLFSILATYLIYLNWSKPQIYLSLTKAPVELTRFMLGFGFLAIYWFTYNILPFIARNGDRRPRNLVKSSIVFNSFCFGLLGAIEVQRFNPDLRFHFLMLAAACAVVIALFAQYVIRKDYLRTPYLVIAIAFFTSSLPFKLEREWVDVIWLLEIPILVYLSLYSQKVLYRILGWFLGLTMFVQMLAVTTASTAETSIIISRLSMRLFVVSIGILCFYLTQYLYSLYKAKVKSENERGLSNLYVFSGTILLVLLMLAEVPRQLVTLSWALGAFALFAVGFLVKDSYFRYSAMGMIALAILRILFVDLSGVNTLYRILIFICLGIILLIVSYFYTKAHSAKE